MFPSLPVACAKNLNLGWLFSLLNVTSDLSANSVTFFNKFSHNLTLSHPSHCYSISPSCCPVSWTIVIASLTDGVTFSASIHYSWYSHSDTSEPWVRSCLFHAQNSPRAPNYTGGWKKPKSLSWPLRSHMICPGLHLWTHLLSLYFIPPLDIFKDAKDTSISRLLNFQFPLLGIFFSPVNSMAHLTLSHFNERPSLITLYKMAQKYVHMYSSLLSPPFIYSPLFCFIFFSPSICHYIIFIAFPSENVSFLRAGCLYLWFSMFPV